MKIIVTATVIILICYYQLTALSPNRIRGRMEYQYERWNRFSSSPAATDSANQKRQHQFTVYANTDLAFGTFLNIHSRLYTYWQQYKDDLYALTVLETYWDHTFKDQFLLRIGKQRIAWGTGYAWNPTDMLEPAKNPFRPQEEREGILAIKSDILLDQFSLTLIGIYNNTLNRFELASKLGIVLDPHELSLSIHQVPFQSPSVGFDFVSFLSTIEIHGELAVLNSQNLYYLPELPYPAAMNSYLVKTLIGTMYTIKPDAMLVLEYYHNESQDRYPKYFADKLVLQNPYIMDMWRDTLFLMLLKREILGIIDVQVMLFSHLKSSHFIFSPRIVVTPLAALSFELMYHGLSKFHDDLSLISGWRNERIQLKALFYF